MLSCRKNEKLNSFIFGKTGISTRVPANSAVFKLLKKKKRKKIKPAAGAKICIFGTPKSGGPGYRAKLTLSSHAECEKIKFWEIPFNKEGGPMGFTLTKFPKFSKLLLKKKNI